MFNNFLFIIVYFLLRFDSTIEYIQTQERIHQAIVFGPEDTYTFQGETIQFPCIVSKQTNAIVTWCWNDFCTLGKAQFVRQESTSNGPIKIYQYIAYPRFYLFINEQLSNYESFKKYQQQNNFISRSLQSFD